MKIYLDFFGYVSVGDDLDKSKNGFRYCEFHGGIDKDLREKNRTWRVHLYLFSHILQWDNGWLKTTVQSHFQLSLELNLH